MGRGVKGAGIGIDQHVALVQRNVRKHEAVILGSETREQLPPDLQCWSAVGGWTSTAASFWPSETTSSQVIGRPPRRSDIVGPSRPPAKWHTGGPTRRQRKFVRKVPLQSARMLLANRGHSARAGLPKTDLARALFGWQPDPGFSPRSGRSGSDPTWSYEVPQDLSESGHGPDQTRPSAPKSSCLRMRFSATRLFLSSALSNASCSTRRISSASTFSMSQFG
ncbi:hypothetical protein FOHLNKBM_5668 [Methylobacterium longum]|nr:hypothetical protein FOHLNKBM_5668 [Methylobacterium longum]